MVEMVNWDEFDLDGDDVVTEYRDAALPDNIDVPDSIVALLQKSWDEKTWVKKSFRGMDPQNVNRFITLVKAAGSKTIPPTSAFVADREDDSIVVEFKATERRGRQPGKKESPATKKANATQK